MYSINGFYKNSKSYLNNLLNGNIVENLTDEESKTLEINENIDNGQFITTILNWGDFSRSLRDPTSNYKGVLRANIDNIEEIRDKFRGPTGPKGPKGDDSEYYKDSFLGLHTKDPKSFVHMKNNDKNIPTQVLIDGENNSSIGFTNGFVNNDGTFSKGAKVTYDIGGKFLINGVDNSVEKDNNFIIDLNNTGNVGIGTKKPDRKLEVVSNDDAMMRLRFNDMYYTDYSTNGISTYPNNQFSFKVNGDEKMRIHTNGNVGIGINEPNEKLSVNGNLKLTGPDIFLDNQNRKGINKGPRRALVHDESDKLTVNYNSDYTGGVEINGNLNLIGNLKQNGMDINLSGNPVPLGSIIMWSGDINKIPEGYVLCDGNNGIEINKIKIPDLSGSFLVAYDKNDNDYNVVGKKGGKKKVILKEDEIPKHYHKNIIRNNGDYYDNEELNIITDVNGEDLEKIKVKKNIISITTDEISNLKTGKIGNNESHENRPPYYTIAYIIRVG